MAPEKAGQFFCLLKETFHNPKYPKSKFQIFAIKQTRKRLFNSLLTRINRADFSKRVIPAGEWLVSAQFFQVSPKFVDIALVDRPRRNNDFAVRRDLGIFVA